MSLFFTMSQKCVKNHKIFCYVCGELTVEAERRCLTPLVKKVYKLHVGWKFGDQDKLWAPHICCGTCASKINKWLHGSRPSKHVAGQILWREPKSHFRDCYFCLTNVKDFFAQSTHGMQYQNLHSAVRPVPHDSFTIPNPPIDWTFGKEDEESFSDNGRGATTGTECQDPDFFL